jgi:hypothetical protein
VRGLFLVIAAAVLSASAGHAARVSSGAISSPPSLTAVGRLTWELDGLLHRTFGSRQICFDNRRVTLFAVTNSECPLPFQRYLPYEYTFEDTVSSALRLVSLKREPITGVTNSPVRIRGHYVSCPNGHYHHSKRGWLVFGGGGPTPGSWFWCN